MKVLSCQIQVKAFYKEVCVEMTVVRKVLHHIRVVLKERCGAMLETLGHRLGHEATVAAGCLVFFAFK